MARYTGPKARRWRRLGQVPSDGTATVVQRRNYPPGQHGLRRRSKLSEYAVQLREKQKAKYTYGLLERQFSNYYRKADRDPGVTGEILMKSLELRLDNVVFRLGVAASRDQARQAVVHGHVRVNDQKVDRPSYEVGEGDEITISKKLVAVLKTRLDEEAIKGLITPDWLSLDPKTLHGKVVSVPARSDIDATINEQLIVEYYSR